MFLHLLSVTLTFVFVNGVTRMITPNYKAVNFAKEIRGRRLNGSVFRETEVDSEGSCRLQCVEEDGCLSYNFGPNENKKRFKCQLSDSDRFVGLKNFTEDDEFLYRGVKSACEMSSSLCGEKGVCIPNYQDASVRCKCNDGYKGKPCKPKSCVQHFQDGFTSSGMYTINPDGGKPMQVLCDMTTGGGGWTVFQRRWDGSVDFYLGWESYKRGFGDLNGEFWLGNDNLHRLTAADDVMLRVDLEDFDGNITYAEYTTFKVADEGDKYRLLIGGYSGTAGDSMYENDQLANGMQFTTRDEDNDQHRKNCAVSFKGGWWYRACHNANLNGLYHGGPYESYADGVCWKAFRGLQYSLKHTEMKLRPVILKI
ncbi:microfibril-associated glycoprotein 4-like [Oculina patagonica]